jgi:hypothetical protein
VPLHSKELETLPSCGSHLHLMPTFDRDDDLPEAEDSLTFLHSQMARDADAKEIIPVALSYYI